MHLSLSRRAIVTVMAIAALVIGCAAVGIYLLNRDDDKGSAEKAGRSNAPASPGASSGPAPSTPTAPGPGGGSAQPGDAGAAANLAEQAVAAINAHDSEAMKKISCDPDTAGPADAGPLEVRAELASAPELAGDTATVEVKLTIGGESTTTPLPLRKKDGAWCVE